jgi:putative endonuclease
MRKPRHFFVYIMTNNQRSTCCTPVFTRDLPRRVFEHQKNFVPGFASRYKLTHLVY